MLGIIGKGAISSLLASRAHHVNISHTLLCRTAIAKPLNYRLHKGESGRFTPQFKLPEQANTTEFDMLLIPIKAYDVVGALQQWQHCISAKTIIVLLNNGMGPHESVQSQFAANPVAALTTSYGALKVSDSEVKETGIGECVGGWLSQPEKHQEPSIIKLFNTLLPPCTWQTNALPALWQKLSINCVINPLTAVHNVTNGALANPEFAPVIAKLVAEFVSVANRAGQAFSYQDLLKKVYAVIRNTAQNYSSMRQDVHYGRQTEIDFINGYLLTTAERQNISLPEHQRLYEQVKSIT